MQTDPKNGVRRIGILGGGQLGQMMALAGLPLGLDFHFLDPSADACARLVGRLHQAEYSDLEAVRTLAGQIDIASIDFENVPAESAQLMAELKPFYPGVDALSHSQDRLVEKNLIRQLGISVPAFVAVNSRTDLLAALDVLGYPAVLKTRRLGYDGKGQEILHQQEDLERAWQRLGHSELILEQFIPFEAECSLVSVRSRTGEIRFWPLTRNVHSNGILMLSLPGVMSAGLQQEAEYISSQLLETLNYVGVMTVEFFVKNSSLQVNEIAPRVHNSGHWTIDAAVTSQFENHLRAICDMPLGETAMTQPSLMFNWIGNLPNKQKLLSVPGVCWHEYGKSARPGRKLGHCTVIAENRTELNQRCAQIADDLGSGWPGLLTLLT
jgi:5-(carboxyamino)imidazole ribonucleotide synthase